MIYAMLILIGFSISWQLGLALIGLTLIELRFWYKRAGAMGEMIKQVERELEKSKETQL